MTFWVWACFVIKKAKHENGSKVSSKTHRNTFNTSQSSLFPSVWSSNTIQEHLTHFYKFWHRIIHPRARNSWVHSISLSGEMRMYSLKSRYYSPYLFLCNALYASAHTYYSLNWIFSCRHFDFDLTYTEYFVLLIYTWLTSTPHPCINAHRPWACRGMPFDDVHQDMFERVSLGAGISIR